MKHILTAIMVAVTMFRMCEITNSYSIALLVAIVNYGIATVAMDELFGAKKKENRPRNVKINRRFPLNNM